MRLTKRTADNAAVVCENCPKKGNCNIPSSCLTVMTNKLCDYEDAEERGLLVHLPCKVGDTLYRPFFNSKHVLEYKIIRIMLRDTEILFTACHYECNMKKYEELVYIWQIGKKFFLTREEAEAVLKGKRKGDGT